MRRTAVRSSVFAIVLLAAAVAAGCGNKNRAAGKAAERLDRRGDEIVVAGQLYHIGAPVVLWTDPGGFDAYRTERRFVPWERASYDDTVREYRETKPDPRAWVNQPNRYGVRFLPSTQPTTRTDARPGSRLTPEQFEQVRGGGWPLELLQEKVDQFVLHYDVAGTARSCFNTLHDHRGLSVQFMLDLDGTIYQSLDVKEACWHATRSNSRSVGIEIANIGAYPPGEPQKTLDKWYTTDEQGRPRMVMTEARQRAVKTPGFVPRPAREQRVVGTVQNATYEQYDLTPQQYDSLIKLTAALCTVLPKIQPDYPRGPDGKLITHVLNDEQWASFGGVLGHYHVQRNKQDPGPALQWDKVINGARKRMGLKPLPSGDGINSGAKESVAAK